MSYWFYILKNRDKLHHVGITRLPPDKLVAKHNKGEIAPTREKGPWKLAYAERYKRLAEATGRKKEVDVKRGGHLVDQFITQNRRSRFAIQPTFKHKGVERPKR